MAKRKATAKDLFDDTTMSFGEHLEMLRMHLIKALIGLVLCVILTLFIGDRIVAVIRSPIDRALQKYNAPVTDDLEGTSFWETAKSWLGMGDANQPEDGLPEREAANEPPVLPTDNRTIVVSVKGTDLANALHRLHPDVFPPSGESGVDEKLTLQLPLSSPVFAEFRQTTENQRKPVTLNVQEAFMTYLWVSLVAGLILASPWVFYQLWLFVAAGLYAHERRYVYTYLPMSVSLFLGGASFCFFVVFPFVLKFLLGFNAVLGFLPQIRISEWINFAIVLPLMFGISFQLPMVMLFLERISIFEAKDYREKRRLSILVISIVSMVLTPADPWSMLAMMFPLLGLYELGILLCDYSPSQKNPFAAEEE